jgi:hypothetical protein
MTQGHEPTERKGPYGPFGDIGDEIAQTAGYLIEYLSEEPEPIAQGMTELSDSDEQILSTWIGMEWLIPIIDVPNEPLVDGAIRRQAHDAVVAFHVALPYNEAERQWLDRKSMGITGEISTFMQGQEDRLMIAGVRRVVSGRELMQRWMMWRREAGEFAGQDAVAEACDALRRVQDVMGLVNP